MSTEPIDLDTAERCKHCGFRIVENGHGWVHAEGMQERKHTCAITPYGYDAAPHGEPCSIACIGRSDATLYVVKDGE